MTKIFLTGASGLLGGHVMRQCSMFRAVQLIATHHDSAFTIPDFFARGNSSTALDLTNETEIWNAISVLRPDVIIHTAAMTEPAACEWNRDQATAVNLEASKRLGALAEHFDSRLIYISTDLVFDGTKGNYHEEDEPNPLSFYAETKYRAEEFLLQTLENSVVLRPSLLLGKSPRGLRSTDERLIADSKAGKKISLFTDEIRNPILAESLAKIILEFAVGFAAQTSGLFHAAGTKSFSRAELGTGILKRAGLLTTYLMPVLSESIVSVPARPRNLSFNSSKLQGILGEKMNSLFEIESC
jgi:dTDP-4-dehydrorhamnose reductase